MTGFALSFSPPKSVSLFSRTGRGGVFQVDTEGFVAAAFTHRNRSPRGRWPTGGKRLRVGPATSAAGP